MTEISEHFCSEVQLRRPTSISSTASSTGSIMDGTHKKQIVILVVGNTEHNNAGVVQSLTSRGEWDKSETAGVGIFTCQATARTVVDTIPLEAVEGRSPTAVARRWISRNGLRRVLFGKLVVVVCVLPGKVGDGCKWDVFSYATCWVDVFGLIFNDHKESIMMVVNTGDKENLAVSTKLEVEHFVVEHGFSKHNITYSDLKGGDDSVRKLVFDSIRLTKTNSDGKISKLQSFLYSNSPSKREKHSHVGNGEHHPAYLGTVTPFFMEEVSSETERFGPWGPERVILFGRTGSGKSTLAQMLTSGALRLDNKKFLAKSGLRGVTKKVEHGEGRGWYVLDTPGFGEPKGCESTVPTQEVEKMIKNYVKMLEGTFSHYIFVVKMGRLDELEERLWKFFVLLFGEEIQQHFSVVVSNADEEWVQKNMAALRGSFKGCTSFLSAEFPPVDEEDSEIEGINEEIRAESLQQLEENLAALNRVDMHCKYGRHSRMHICNERERANGDLEIQRDSRLLFLTKGAEACFNLGSFFSLLTRPLTELTSMLSVDDEIALLPS